MPPSLYSSRRPLYPNWVSSTPQQGGELAAVELCRTMVVEFANCTAQPVSISIGTGLHKTVPPMCSAFSTKPSLWWCVKKSWREKRLRNWENAWVTYYHAALQSSPAFYRWRRTYANMRDKQERFALAHEAALRWKLALDPADALIATARLEDTQTEDSDVGSYLLELINTLPKGRHMQVVVFAPTRWVFDRLSQLILLALQDGIQSSPPRHNEPDDATLELPMSDSGERHYVDPTSNPIVTFIHMTMGEEE